ARWVVEAAQKLRESGLARAILTDDGERRTGRYRQIETVEHRLTRIGVGEAEITKPDSMRRHAGCQARSPGKRTGLSHGFPKAQHRTGRCGSNVESPGQSAAGDHAGAD